MAVSGLLLRSGWSLDETRNFVRQAAKAANDDEWDARGRDAESTAERLEAGGAVTGMRQLIQILGKEVVSRFCHWLDLKGAVEFHATDLGNAGRLVARHREDIRFHERGKWLVWSGTRWVFNNTGEIDRKAKDTIRGLYEEAAAEKDPDVRGKLLKWAKASEAEGHFRSMISMAKTEPGVPVLAMEMDADPWLLNCGNGTLNLKTGELGPHRREDLITKQVPVNYDADAKCPNWDNFLGRIMEGNEALIAFLQRAVGYSLTGDTKEQVFFILCGGGANGKSTFLETVKAFLGDYARTADPAAFLAKKVDTVGNDIARLAGARFVSAQEVEIDRRLAEALIKQITGGDTITARFLYEEAFEFNPQFKLFLAVNHKPEIRGRDKAIWRRIHLVPFNVIIPPEEQDRSLIEKLKAELPGILAWAERGCRDWVKQGLNAPKEVSAATKAYREEMDILRPFLEECCVVGPQFQATAAALYVAYRHHCKKGGEEPLTQTAFGRRLRERGFQSETITHGEGKGRKLWRGLGLMDEEDDLGL